MTGPICVAKPWTALLGEARPAPVHPVETLVHASRAAADGVPDRTALACFDGRLTYPGERLAAYEYPREVEILAELPGTASGKILGREPRSPR
ncbi:hypothetical protein OG909_04925 [Streptomyces sp. NBC_01754]|uniref:hypothetical protein n=1 Tax=Streptomyces sp. NBC_01754 TaxID=2975930 RepID=UPI002DD8CCD8|nr:hypothetical protein [Streptomyces sp. NBC_01754]WSC97058.1 hypothetical protein OG909_04925 [Streptomyces sp. NBC_01754]